jgi:hypothetical protein
MHASERARAVRSGNSALDVHDRDGETRRIVKVSILALERLDYCPTILCCMVCGVACSPDSPSCQCSRKRFGGLASGSLRSSTKHELRLGMMMDIENFGCETRLHVPSVYMDNSKDGSLRDRTSCYHGRGEIYSRSYLRHALETETEWGPFMQLKRRGSLI